MLKQILAKKYRNLRAEAGTSRSDPRPATRLVDKDNKSSAITNSLSRDALEGLISQVTDNLERNKIYEWSNRALRNEMNTLLQPEITNLFQAFSDVEQEMEASEVEGKDTGAWDSCCQDLLLQEARDIQKIVGDQTIKADDKLQKKSDSISNQLPFLIKKHRAIQTLALSQEWENSPQHVFSAISNRKGNNSIPSDAFGFIENKNKSVNEAIRKHQRENLIRAIHLRSRLGYSTLALESTVEEAGRGIYVDGFCPAGSLLAFFPGYVWPKEQLLKSSVVAHIFKDDPLYHLSMRYDDILIDSRKAPYTVLNGENSNPFAIGHIANHPPKGVQPNCSTTMVNFFEYSNDSLSKYIPNMYGRDPMFLGPGLFDRKKIVMHGFGLLAMRDIQNEECFYDYRLKLGQNHSYPDWYHVPENNTSTEEEEI